LKLDIGCGRKTREGFVGMDVSPEVGAAFVHDWDVLPWPFDGSSIDEINASHVLEHTKDLIAFMNECHRILKPGGTMHVECPHYTSIGAWQDPTHVRAITEMTFAYFCAVNRKAMDVMHYPITADFAFTYSCLVDPEWAKGKPQEHLDMGVKHSFNVCHTIKATLTKR
jgi:SAM-dependent methyltransferase